MAQNVTIQGASYQDVPAIDVPKTGGGTARFMDTSINLLGATASDIYARRKAYVNGELITGVALEAIATVSNGTLTLTDGFPVSV